jgi:hypothetical protein
MLELCEKTLSSKTVEIVKVAINGVETQVYLLRSKYKDGQRRREHLVAEVRLGEETLFLVYYCFTKKIGLVNLLAKRPATTFDEVFFVVYNNKRYETYTPIGQMLLAAVESNVPPSICPLITEPTQV